MNKQDDEGMTEQTTQGKPKVERQRQATRDTEPSIVRVKLPEAVGIRAKETVAELRARGAQVTLDELLCDYIGAISERYFDSQLQSKTPEPYYLEAAARVPELREMLIRQAKKGLMRNTATLSEPRGPRRGRRKAEGIETGGGTLAADAGAK